MSRHFRGRGLQHRETGLGPARWLALCAAVAGLAAAMPAMATMYKWVDANGKTVYSDQPPPGNVKTEVIKPPPPPDNPNALQELRNAEAEMKARDKQKADAAKDSDKKRADSVRKQEICTNALAQIRALEHDDLYRYDSQGNRFYVDADTRRQETQVQQRLVRENCAN